MKFTGAEEFLPFEKTLPALKDAVARCRGCDLYRNATQAVFGEGRKSSPVVFIGEQPGNEEDQEGRPFVGPAGRLLNKALAEAGIDRAQIYLTNAVKHFKFEERRKWRIHKKPTASESHACRPWLEEEISAIRPRMIVCLGATAAHSVFGPDYRVTQRRGEFERHPWAPQATSTVHPSAILRTPDDQREIQYKKFVEDLKKIAATMSFSP
jgi:uracil-DNA glycosylase